MKKSLFVIFALLCAVQMAARGNEQVVVINPNHGHHSGLPIWPADEPTVYYDDEEMVITIDGSSLAEDSYKIIITSSIGNTYQGVFTDGVPGKK
jgi:hypothetical protein